MTERTTSAEDTQNQHYQCVHTVVDSFLELLLVLRSVNMAGVHTPPCFGDPIPKYELTTAHIDQFYTRIHQRQQSILNIHCSLHNRVNMGLG